MKTINYPLLCYQFNEEAVLGILVGTDYQVMDKTLKQVKNQLSDYLTKMYKKEDFYPYVDLEKAKLKIINVKIRPGYKDQTGRYPMSQTVVVPVPVVHGETEEGFFECYLPLFDESFYYYDARQFNSLVQHFAADLLNDLSPEELYSQLNYPKPSLDLIPLRINENRRFKASEIRRSTESRYKILPRLASQYPYPKSQRRQITASPEAAWELEDKVEEVIEKITQSGANVLVIGNHGVGKSAVLQQAMRKISGKKREKESGLNFWQLMPQRITASAKYLGEWEETIEEMIEELQQTRGILWVVDVVRLLQIGGAGPANSVAAFMISFLQSAGLQIIGEATEKELESMRRMLPGFASCFQVVKIPEMSETKVQRVMSQFGEYSQNNLKINVKPEAQSLAYRLLLRYYPYQSFPGKAVKFLGQCVSDAQLDDRKEVGFDEVIKQFVGQTGLPELFLRDDILLDKEQLQSFFTTRIIGQSSAIKKMTSIVKVFKAGLNNPGKPISTLIFAGPTGVGKTASAKALAEYFFGKSKQQLPLIRIDMSEFQHPFQITRLIGSGSETGKLIQDIRQRPFAVVLLDEVDKAAPSIFDALMTMLDEGLMVDSFGRLTNFRNTIIIMTTNLGASNRASVGFKNTTSGEAAYMSAIGSFFRPEFINRIDGVVMFNNLGQDNIREICVKELNDLKNREGFAKRNIDLEFTEQVIDYLSRTGFDEKYGARPLQRVIEQNVISPIANWLLGQPKLEGVRLKIDLDGGKLNISVV